MRRASSWIAGLIALAGCRQVFGIDEPLPNGSGLFVDARSGVHDASAFLLPGLSMYVEPNVVLWNNDQPPDVAWAATNQAMAESDIWIGDGPTLGDVVSDGVVANAPFSVWLEGQIYAADGDAVLQLTANDFAFFDAETTPGSGVFTHIVSSSRDKAMMITSHGVIAGWYRVRIGWSSSGASPDFQLLHESATDPNIVPYNASNLRH